LYFLWSLMRQFKIRTGSTDNYLKQAGTEKSFNSEGITTLKLLKFGELNANWDGIEKQIHKRKWEVQRDLKKKLVQVQNPLELLILYLDS
jgi:hypothetical protein